MGGVFVYLVVARSYVASFFPLDADRPFDKMLNDHLVRLALNPRAFTLRAIERRPLMVQKRMRIRVFKWQGVVREGSSR